MAVETDDDRAIFFDTDDFGVVATITPNVGPEITVTGIFDAVHVGRGVRQDNGYSGQVDFSGNNPTFRAKAAPLACVKAGRATIEIEGVTYAVHDTKPDGTGITILILKKA